MEKGESGIITFVKTGLGWGKGGHCGLKKRLMDMGLTPSTRVTVVSSAPFRGIDTSSC